VVTPISSVFRAETRIVTLYTVDVGVVWVWLTSILPKVILVADLSWI